VPTPRRCQGQAGQRPKAPRRRAREWDILGLSQVRRAGRAWTRSCGGHTPPTSVAAAQALTTGICPPTAELGGTHQGSSLGWPLSSLVRQRPRVPWKLGPMAPPGDLPTWQHRRVGQQTQGAPGQTGRETVGWPGLSVRPGGGDAHPDPTLACSRAAHRGGLNARLRRLTAIRDGRSWRRDPLAARPRQRIRSADGALSFTGSTPPSVGSGLAILRSGESAT
jgi:hypothetical protein